MGKYAFMRGSKTRAKTCICSTNLSVYRSTPLRIPGILCEREIPALPSVFRCIFCQRCRRQFLIPFFFFLSVLRIDAFDLFLSLFFFDHFETHEERRGWIITRRETDLRGKLFDKNVERAELIVARLERNTVAKVLANGH